MQFPEYELYDGLGLAELIAKGDMSANEVLDAAIERIELLNPYLNAINYTMFDQAKASLADLPEGPFKGVPFALKDLGVSYANEPTSAGCRWLKDFCLDFDSEIVSRYKKNGLVILGKTNVPEWGWSVTTEPKFRGATRNPWNMELSSGGSSGGAAAAVAARMLPMADASDGGGSIRIPASCCGVFGLKPTRGRTPTGPELGRSMIMGLTVGHILSRSVRDSAAMLDCMGGDDLGNPFPLPRKKSYLLSLAEPVPSLRIAVVKNSFIPATIHTDCLQAVTQAAQLCKDLGHSVEETNLDINGEEFLANFNLLVCAQISQGMKEARQRQGKPRWGDISALIKFMAYMGDSYSATEVAQAIHYLDKLSRHIAEFMQAFDVILTPSLARPPARLGEMLPTTWQNFMMGALKHMAPKKILRQQLLQGSLDIFSYTPFTPLFNVTGQPAMSVPLFWNKDHLPIGVQFAGRYGDEKTLFQLAHQLEQAKPWQQQQLHTKPSRHIQLAYPTVSTKKPKK